MNLGTFACVVLFGPRAGTTSCWIIDTGRSDHMIGSLNMLSNYEPCDQDITVLWLVEQHPLQKEKGQLV